MKELFNGKALIVSTEDINFDEYPNLKIIGCPMTGIEHLPLEYFRNKNIKVISLQGERAFLDDITSTAEHTMGLIISLLRNYKTAFQIPHQNRNFYKGNTLSGKTLGIVGYGRIGVQLATIAEAFGMNVLWVDKNANGELFSGYGNGIQSLYDMLSQSDIVSLHIPLSGNEGFFTIPMFDKMKSTAYLINTSRSKIIQNGALVFALKYAIIKGAAIDFIDDEQLIEYAKEHNNLLLTNHTGGNTFEDRERTEDFIIQKVKEYLNES
mgnify:CR=1 FL=1